MCSHKHHIGLNMCWILFILCSGWRNVMNVPFQWDVFSVGIYAQFVTAIKRTSHWEESVLTRLCLCTYSFSSLQANLAIKKAHIFLAFNLYFSCQPKTALKHCFYRERPSSKGKGNVFSYFHWLLQVFTLQNITSYSLNDCHLGEQLF